MPAVEPVTNARLPTSCRSTPGPFRFHRQGTRNAAPSSYGAGRPGAARYLLRGRAGAGVFTCWDVSVPLLALRPAGAVLPVGNRAVRTESDCQVLWPGLA